MHKLRNLRVEVASNFEIWSKVNIRQRGGHDNPWPVLSRVLPHPMCDDMYTYLRRDVERVCVLSWYIPAGNAVRSSGSWVYRNGNYRRKKFANEDSRSAGTKARELHQYSFHRNTGVHPDIDDA